MAKRTRVTVGMLADGMGTPYPRPLLYCAACHGEYSANRADYWYLPRDHVFTCCRRNLALVRRTGALEPVS